MKRLLTTLLIFSFLLAACNSATGNDTPLFPDDERLTISVSIASIQWLVDQIGGEQVQTQALTTSGDDPHTYEPSPAQMTAIAASDLYFTFGIEFEEVWLPKFTNANPDLQVVDISQGVERIAVVGSHGDEDHDHEGLDPHIWLSPQKMSQIADNIARSLKILDPKNAEVYESNLETVLSVINNVDNQLSQMLSQTRLRQFLIIHPSLGYFADAYGLQMIPVEIDGQEPSPIQLADILQASQDYGIQALFTQTGANPVNVQVLAEQAGIDTLIEIDPMTYDWPANMLLIGVHLQEALN